MVVVVNNSGALSERHFCETSKCPDLEVAHQYQSGVSAAAGPFQFVLFSMGRCSPKDRYTTSFVLHHDPLIVSPDQLFNDILFYLFFWILLQINPYP